MLTLAIEQSTPECSVALLRDGKLLVERTWLSGRRRGQQLFPALTELLQTADADAADIALYAVGLGPGVFSGLRVALATAQSMALPGNDAVRGVSSGEVLALELLASGTPQPLTIVGDARRERLWIATFDWDGTRPRPRGDYDLITVADLPGKIPADATLVTPDWGRIGERLAALPLGNCRLVEHNAIPRAAVLGRLAVNDENGGHQAPALGPIYIHPPVCVKPKVPAQLPL